MIKISSSGALATSKRRTVIPASTTWRRIDWGVALWRQDDLVGVIVLLHLLRAVQRLRQPVALQDDGVLGILGLDLVQLPVQHHPPVVDQQDPVAHLLDLVHVVRAEDDRLAPPLFFQQDLLQHLGVDRVQPLERLVQDQQRRIVDQGGQELGLLRHALAQLLHLAPGVLGQPCLLQQGGGPLAGLLAWHPLQCPQVGQALQQPKALVQAALLRQVADARLAGLGHRLAHQPDGAAVRLDDVHDRADRGRLACPVGAEETKDLPFPNGKADPIHRLDIGIVFDQVFDLDHDNLLASCRPGSLSP